MHNDDPGERQVQVTTELLFNNNYLEICIPAFTIAKAPMQPGDLFFLRCIYSHWPVTNLAQEWGITNYPGSTAAQLASFLAAPAARELADWEWGRITSGEWYWTVLYPRDSPHEALIVLVSTDSDRGLYGVAEVAEANASLFAGDDETEQQALVPVTLAAIDPTPNLAGEHYGTIMVHGVGLAGWTKAQVDLVSKAPE